MLGFNKDRLKAQMRRHDRSGLWLARRIGVTPASICYYLSGKRIPDRSKIVEMAKHLECTFDYLTGQDAPPQAPDLGQTG